LISHILRLASPVMPRDRLKEVVRQLSGIGGGRPTGFGAERVLSLPDGVARGLAHYLGDFDERVEADESEMIPMVIGDLCPDCGAASMVNEEGCRKCYSCGFSEC
jgi:ribonucleoside-diphosphate reductase alpha chain